MDNEEIAQSIKERFDNLQPEIQAAIMDSNYEKNLYDIAQKYKLNIEQMGQLEFNTTLVLLGQTHPDEYAGELADDLKLPKETISQIVADVNEKVMKNIREILKQNFRDDDAREEAVNEVPIPPYKDVPIVQPQASAPVATPSLSKMETGIYENAGIEMMDDDKEDITKTIIGSKLRTATASTNVVSDRSLPKMNPSVQPQAPAPQAPAPIPRPAVPPEPAPSTKPHDPYHEAIG